MNAVAEQAPTFGVELDELRRRVGVSFRGLASRTGLSAGYLSDLVSGHRGHRASDAVIENVARALGVPADYFAEYRRRRAYERFPAEIDELYWSKR